MPADQNVTLSSGQVMPLLGMGTWHHGPKEEIQEAIKYAVKQGYRNIDGAHIYLNESEVGETYKEILEAGEVKREELFIATKLWSTHHEPERVEEALTDSLKKLNLDYVDVYYIHWPAAFKYGDGNLPEDADGRIAFIDVDWMDTYKAMEACVDKGLTKSLGICNFNGKMLKRLLKECKHKPTLLQVESNPRFQNDILRRFCLQNDIRMVAYSPFGSPDLPWGEKLPHLLIDPVLKGIADRLGVSTAKVVLAWQVQRGVSIIPKSVIPSELSDNLGCFSVTLKAEDIATITTLERGVRKIVPLKTLKNGEVELRDKTSPDFPFVEPETEELLKEE